MFMNKKGVSAVVATVLIVMITIAAAGLLWGIVAPVLKSEITERESCVNAQISLSVDEGSKYTCTTSVNGTAVRVSRGSDDEEWNAIQIIYTDSNGNSQTIDYANPPTANSEKVYRNNETINIVSFSAVPILNADGNDLICSKIIEIAPIKNCTVEVSTTISSSGTSPLYNGSNGGGSEESCESYLVQEGAFVLCTCEDLQNMSANLAANYMLGKDINCLGFDYGDGKGFMPVGMSPGFFSGSLDGKDHKIISLHINRSNDAYHLGLFGWAKSAEISDIDLIDLNVSSYNVLPENYIGASLGGLVGYSDNSVISNIFSSGILTGDIRTVGVGSIVGHSSYSNLSNLHSTTNVVGRRRVGGIIGVATNSIVDNSYSTGSVSSVESSYYESNLGGLVGYSYLSKISKSYSTGSVTGTQNNVGGIVGYFWLSNISDSYSLGNLSGDWSVGGLVGNSYSSCSIDNSYSIGKVEGSTFAGGLAGSSSNLKINNSYSIGKIFGSNAGGLAGGHWDLSTIGNSYWYNQGGDDATRCYNDGYGGGDIGCMTEADKEAFHSSSNSPMASWDFVNTWQENDGNFPTLR